MTVPARRSQRTRNKPSEVIPPKADPSEKSDDEEDKGESDHESDYVEPVKRGRPSKLSAQQKAAASKPARQTKTRKTASTSRPTSPVNTTRRRRRAASSADNEESNDDINAKSDDEDIEQSAPPNKQRKTVSASIPTGRSRRMRAAKVGVDPKENDDSSKESDSNGGDEMAERHDSNDDSDGGSVRRAVEDNDGGDSDNEPISTLMKRKRQTPDPKIANDEGTSHEPSSGNDCFGKDTPDQPLGSSSIPTSLDEKVHDKGNQPEKGSRRTRQRRNNPQGKSAATRLSGDDGETDEPPQKQARKRAVRGGVQGTNVDDVSKGEEENARGANVDDTAPRRSGRLLREAQKQADDDSESIDDTNSDEDPDQKGTREHGPLLPQEADLSRNGSRSDAGEKSDNSVSTDKVVRRRGKRERARPAVREGDILAAENEGEDTEPGRLKKLESGAIKNEDGVSTTASTSTSVSQKDPLGTTSSVETMDLQHGGTGDIEQQTTADNCTTEPLLRFKPVVANSVEPIVPVAAEILQSDNDVPMASSGPASNAEETDGGHSSGTGIDTISPILPNEDSSPSLETEAIGHTIENVAQSEVIVQLHDQGPDVRTTGSQENVLGPIEIISSRTREVPQDSIAPKRNSVKTGSDAAEINEETEIRPPLDKVSDDNSSNTMETICANEKSMGRENVETIQVDLAHESSGSGRRESPSECSETPKGTGGGHDPVAPSPGEDNPEDSKEINISEIPSISCRRSESPPPTPVNPIEGHLEQPADEAIPVDHQAEGENSSISQEETHVATFQESRSEDLDTASSLAEAEISDSQIAGDAIPASSHIIEGTSLWDVGARDGTSVATPVVPTIRNEPDVQKADKFPAEKAVNLQQSSDDVSAEASASMEVGSFRSSPSIATGEQVVVKASDDHSHEGSREEATDCIPPAVAGESSIVSQNTHSSNDAGSSTAHESDSKRVGAKEQPTALIEAPGLSATKSAGTSHETRVLDVGAKASISPHHDDATPSLVKAAEQSSNKGAVSVDGPSARSCEKLDSAKVSSSSSTATKESVVNSTIPVAAREPPSNSLSTVVKKQADPEVPSDPIGTSESSEDHNSISQESIQVKDTRDPGDPSNALGNSNLAACHDTSQESPDREERHDPEGPTNGASNVSQERKTSAQSTVGNDNHDPQHPSGQAGALPQPTDAKEQRDPVLSDAVGSSTSPASDSLPPQAIEVKGAREQQRLSAPADTSNLTLDHDISLRPIEVKEHHDPALSSSVDLSNIAVPLDTGSRPVKAKEERDTPCPSTPLAPSKQVLHHNTSPETIDVKEQSDPALSSPVATSNLAVPQGRSAELDPRRPSNAVGASSLAVHHDVSTQPIEAKQQRDPVLSNPVGTANLPVHHSGHTEASGNSIAQDVVNEKSEGHLKRQQLALRRLSVMSSPRIPSLPLEFDCRVKFGRLVSTDSTKQSSVPRVSTSDFLGDCKLMRVKTMLFSMGSKVHRGAGFERIFAEYWDAMALRLSGKLSLHTAEQCQRVINTFLKTSKLRRIHNAFILRVMRRASSPFAGHDEVAAQIPSLWRDRVKVAHSDGNELKENLVQPTSPILSDPAESHDAMANNEYVKEVQLEQNVELKAISARNNVSSSIYRASSSIPGALAVDSLVRSLADKNTMEVSEMAIWLISVAVREHTNQILKTVISQKKSIEAGYLAERRLKFPNGLAGAGMSSSSNERPEEAAKSRVLVRPSKTPEEITILDLFTAASAMPMGRWESVGGSISRSALESSLYGSYDHLSAVPNEDLCELQHYVTDEILKEAKLRAVPSKPKVDETTRTLVPEVHPASTSPVPKQPISFTVPPPAPAVGRSQPSVIAQAVPREQINTSDSASASQESVIRGMGRAGAKDLSALMKQSTPPEVATPTKEEATVAPTQNHATADNVQVAGSGPSEDLSVAGADRKGKGFGAKNLAALRARATTHD